MSHATPMPAVADRTLPAASARVLATAPDDPLLLADDGAYSHAQAHDRALRLAGGLRRLGVAAGDRVVLMLDNSADAALAWFATGLTRVAEVPVNTAYKGEFLAHVVHDSGAEGAVIEQEYAARFAEVADALPHVRGIVVRGGTGSELAGRFRVLPFEELADEPVAPEPTAPDDLLAIAFWDEVRAHDVTYTLLLDAMAQMLLSRPERPDDADNPLEVACLVPLPPDLDGFCRRFGVESAAVFAMTESGAPIVAPPGTVVPGSAGRERPGYRVKVVDEHDHEVPPAVVGELVVRPEEPATTMEGYHGLPEQTLHTFRNLWLHTGDAFSRDEAGQFYFSDRIKDALRRRGENISSFEVESVVNGHPAVAESAVVAVPSELTEDELKVAVVLCPGAALDPAELIEHLVPRMPYFTVPRYVEILEELPKTPTQKVQKAVLRARGLTAGTWDREAHGITVGRS